MSETSNQERLQQQIDLLSEHFLTIRRNMEKVMAENQRLREVVRLAENELRKRREQVSSLEQELNSMQHQRREIKDRVEHSIEKLDHVIATTQQEQADA